MMRISINNVLKISYILLIILIFSNCNAKKPVIGDQQKNIQTTKEQQKYPIIVGPQEEDRIIREQLRKTLSLYDEPFDAVCNAYFENNDTSEFNECIGKIIRYEDLKAGPSYNLPINPLPDNPLRIYSISNKPMESKIHFKNAKDNESKIIICTTAFIHYRDGHPYDYLILDMKGFEGNEGYSLKSGMLAESRPEENQQNSNIPAYYNFGIFEFKRNVGWYDKLNNLEKRVIPEWIVSVDKNGKIEINKSEDSGKISINDVFDIYYRNGDTTWLEQCIGKTVYFENENKKTKSSSSEYPLTHPQKRERFVTFIRGDSISMRIIYTVEAVENVYRSDEENDYKILDINTVEGDRENYLYSERLKENHPENNQYNIDIPNSFGLLEISDFEMETKGLGNYYDKRLTPGWIIEIDEDGHINISKPENDSRFIVISSSGR